MSRFGYVMTTYFWVVWIVVTAFLHPSPHLLWNTSASAPTGLYALRPVQPLARGDLVAAMPPPTLADFMSRRRYLPKGVPLLKYVAALPGQAVCRHGLTVTIDGKPAATALTRDHVGRPLPAWSGCVTLKPGQVFLLNPAVPASFDGRYFGVLPAAALTARAVPLFQTGSR